MIKYLIPVIYLSLLFFSSPAIAETKVFIKEYSYQASEDDSRNSSRTLALREVKRLLLEELGTYLESVTEVQNLQLTKDQITTLTAGIVMTEVVDDKWDGRIYWLKAKITADPKEVIKSINLLRQDRQKTKELEETRNKVNELLTEVERLKKGLASSKKDQTKIARYDEAIKELSATDWLEKGYALGNVGRHQEAMEAFTRAIELNPQNALAYGNRSFAYSHLGNHQQALEDSNKAIELNPQYALAYGYRSLAYGKLGNRQQALEDSNKAIELDPQNARAYVIRGSDYFSLGKYQQALADANKAIELNPKLALAYVSRSLAYGKLGNRQQALEDSNKAIELDPQYGGASVTRGIAFEKLGNNVGAKADYKKACEFGIKWACEKSSGNVQLNGSQKTEEKGKTSSLRIFQPGDYINYKMTGFVSIGGVDVPIFGTAQYRLSNRTQVDYYGNQCKIFEISMDFKAVGKDRSVRVTRFVDQYFTQDLHGSLMIHGNKDYEKRISSFVKAPSTGWYLAVKCPFTAGEPVSQNIEFTDGSSKNGTDMVLSQEQVSVPAGVFRGVKTISNTLTTNADLSKTRSMETTWLVPEIGPVRVNLESSSDKGSMKFIFEMTDTNIPYK